VLPSHLGELLALSSKKHPLRYAIIFGSKKITYHHLNELANQIASGLIELGINKQDKIALFLDNCPEFIISYFAVLKAGCIVVPINYMFKIEEAKQILEDSCARAIITSRPYLDMAEELRLRLDSLKFIISTSKAAGDTIDIHKLRSSRTENLKKLSILPNDLAVIIYTSGTTGVPKGAMLSHHNLISNAHDCSKAIKVSHKDAVICILPLFHSFAATVCMNLPLFIGAKIVVMKSVKSFKRIIRAIRKNRVSVFVGIPSVYNILKDIKLPKIIGSLLIKFLNPVKICISGAAALPQETLLSFEKKFRIPLLEGYGLTEASPVVTLNPLYGIRKPGSIGPSLSENIALKAVNERGEEVISGETGELLVKGPNVMIGYYKLAEATGETIKDGWLYTGDMVRFDSEGYYYVIGRKKEMVNVRGLNVYPREIEEVLYHNPKIKEAAVIGIADAHKGEVPKGFVVLKEGENASEHEIIHYLRERLAPYKIPKYIEFRQSLPKNSTGKILKRLLQDEKAECGVL